jgi:hypothetical protein
MKKLLIAITVTVLVEISANAQYIVYDPINNVQQILDEIKNMAEYAEMVDNQVQQINTLDAQLQAFGNPATLVNIIGANQLIGDLNQAVTGQSLNAVQNDSQGIDAMTFNANGLYLSIGSTFQTPSGSQVQREDDIYRENAAVETATGNYTNVYNNATQRRLTLRSEISTTTAELQTAKTASEVQKLTGVLVGQNADLADTDKEIDQAANLTLVQDAENRDDENKQSKARLEEQQAEFSEALTNCAKAFQPDTEAPNFPTQ